MRDSIATLSDDLKSTSSHDVHGKSIESAKTDFDIIAVIVNEDNHEEISVADLRNYYTDKVNSWKSGRNIVVYHLPLGSDARQQFSQKILQLTALEAATQASNRRITNRSVNESLTKTETLVMANVARNPDAIGYVPLATINDQPHIRVIMTLTN